MNEVNRLHRHFIFTFSLLDFLGFISGPGDDGEILS